MNPPRRLGTLYAVIDRIDGPEAIRSLVESDNSDRVQLHRFTE